MAKKNTSQEPIEATEVPETTLTIVEGQLPDAQLQKEYKKRCGIIRKQVANIQSSFLTIAFQLHWIREHNMFKLEGCKNIYDYAEKEYGIGRTSCCNLVCIVEHFASRDGNGNVIESIAECYQNFTASQLVAMIGMSEEGKKQVTPDMSVRAINRMRKEEQAKALPAPASAPIAVTEAIVTDRDSGAGAAVAATVHASEAKPDASTPDEPKPTAPQPAAVTATGQEQARRADTLLTFDSYTAYQKELERIDTMVERAFKKSKHPVTVKIICEPV